MLREIKSYKPTDQFPPYGYLNKVTKNNVRVISTTSGKGGVGKTNVTANLAYSLVQLGKKVLIFDADLGLANIDILLGLAPKYTIEHIIKGQKKLSDIIVSGPGGIHILPGSSGVEELTNLSLSQRRRLIDEFSLLNEVYDFLLIDTPAGISSNVIYFNLAALEIINIVEPDPTSFTDAYALMKVLSVRYGIKRFKIIVNSVDSEGQAQDIFEKLKLVSNKFLDLELEYLGFIFRDDKLIEAVRRQRAVVDLYPYSRASRCFYRITNALCDIEDNTYSSGFQRFINKLLSREI